MKSILTLLTLSLAIGCTSEKNAEICDDGEDNDGNELVDCDDASCNDDAACVDADGDGSPASLDCDDNDALANPDATETCDGIDNNCDGVVDEGLTSIYYADADGDAYGDPVTTQEACTVPSGYVADNTDCDDTSDISYPGASEVCDGEDNDCNDVVDDDPSDPVTYYLDGDGDGYGLDASTVDGCELPSGYADKGGDCDDADAVSFPGAEEICDTLDNDCDTEVDEEPVDGTTYYADADADGFGDPATVTTYCDPVSGYVLDGSDCDDTTNEANPDAPEICDGIDNDCDLDIDDADANVINASQTTWYLDGDGDGYGVDGSTIDACLQPSGYAEMDGDCDDAEAAAFPGGAEVCDNIDNDCDGTPDDKPSDGTLYYQDADGDGYGADNLTLISCSQPSGYAVLGGDCDEGSSTTNPGAAETCDGVDNNCSGDENDASDTLTWYLDDDGDGDGDANSTTASCDQPFGYVALNTDCDDTLSTVYFGAEEVCDGIDNDCDSDIDQLDSDFDLANLLSFYLDADGDGFGDDATLVQDCIQPSGYISLGGDCNDDSADSDGDGVADGYVTNPASVEVWYDGIDGDCDGMSDYDADMDGEDSDQYGGSDCDDTDFDLNNLDLDGDTWSTCDGDCNDELAVQFPGSAYNETSPLDTQCLIDADGDGYAGQGESCFILDVVDTGAFWDAAAIDITLDGIYDSSYTNLAGGTETYSFCLAPGLVEMTYTCTSTYDCANHTFYLYDENGGLIYSDGYAVYGTAPLQGVFYSGSTAAGNDCDDTDPAIGPEDVDGDGSSACAGDCDDNDSSVFGYDIDGDGFTTCDGDCDESLDDLDNDGVADGSLINPGAIEIWGDGIDQNCDGMSDFDVDGDGDDSINDGGTDCDDTDPAVDGLDIDGDGFTTCFDLVTGLADCDDFDEFTYPGAAFNEYVCSDSIYVTEQTCIAAGECDDPTFTSQVDCESNAGVWTPETWTQSDECLRDFDGDGYSSMVFGGCFTLEMQDSYGDGWNNAALTIYSDGVVVDSGQPAVGTSPAGSFYISTGYTGSASFCADGSNLELQYTPGIFESEVTYQLYDESGQLIFQDGTYPATGLVFTLALPSSGSDCDDTDPLINFQDGDGDGYLSCMGDCNDADPSLTPADLDGDGYSTCDGDCNDDPVDPTSININPGVAENYYDGVDENCDGLSDYDADMDGEDDVTYGGTDCDDTDASVGAGLPEICDLIDNDCDGLVDDDDAVDPTLVSLWYVDGDGDGYGDDTQNVAQCSPPSGYISTGGDCNDTDNTISPGATEVYYDGTDGDCDGMSDFDADMDGEDSDQYGGTDCDDSDPVLNSLFDNDIDGYSTCDGDCDDNDGYTYPGAAFNDSLTECLTDFDGDGYGMLEESCFDLELVDTGSFWDASVLTISLDGVEWASYSNVGGGSEFYSTCVDAGAITFEYVCTSTYDCPNHTIYVSDSSGNVLYADGNQITGTEPLQGVFFTANASDLATDCDDTDPTIGATDADNDGYVDCLDDCDPTDPLSLGEELCFDGVDNDCDGLVDCDDSGCDTVCTEYYCDDGIDNDSNGLSDCDDSQCEFDPACFEYECGDGLDDDNDGLSDCDDLDCEGALDCIELVCDDGVDDDIDGLADCDDPDCVNDAYCFDYCLGGDSDGDGILDNDLQSATGLGIASGTNIGGGDNFQPGCSPGIGGEDVVFQWTSPGSGTYTFSTASSDYDTVLYMLDSCVGTEIDCNDDVDYMNADYTSSLDVFVAQGETITIVIDAYEVTETGNYMLDVVPSYEPDCGDGVDNDGDGDIDCDDSDCGFDAACALATCPNFDLLDLDTMVVTGNNTTSTDQTQGTCGSSGGLDFNFLWTAPDDGCLEIDTQGSTYDTTLYIMDQCNGSVLDCNDDSFGVQSYLSHDVIAGEDYILVVDGYSSFSTGDYVMNLLFTAGTTCF